jgi:hypothetical protein
VAREFPSDRALKDYLHEHPQADRSKHTVSDGKEEAKPEKPSLKDRITQALKSVPAKAKRFVQDEGYRRGQLMAAGDAIADAPAKFASNALKHIKKEGVTFVTAGQGIKAALQGKPLSTEQKTACKTVARDIAVTVAVAALTGGVAGLAGKSAVSFATTLAKKIALNAVTDDFGDLLTNFESLKDAGGGLFTFLMKLGKEKRDPHDILAQLVTAQVMKELKKLSTEDMLAALES